ncbi:MAG: hypothetical protein ABJH05_08535 [Fulvivirga sp.]
MSKLKTLALMLIACFGMQCSSAQNQTHDQKEVTASFSENQSILAETNNGNHYVNVASGDNIVFKITSTSGGDPKNDTQIKTELIFQISNDNSSFEMKDVDNAYLQRHCRCIDAGFNLIKTGNIKGTKLKNGTWSLSIDVIAEGNDSQTAYPFIFKGDTNHN